MSLISHSLDSLQPVVTARTLECKIKTEQQKIRKQIVDTDNHNVPDTRRMTKLMNKVTQNNSDLRNLRNTIQLRNTMQKKRFYKQPGFYFATLEAIALGSLIVTALSSVFTEDNKDNTSSTKLQLGFAISSLVAGGASKAFEYYSDEKDQKEIMDKLEESQQREDEHSQQFLAKLEEFKENINNKSVKPEQRMQILVNSIKAIPEEGYCIEIAPQEWWSSNILKNAPEDLPVHPLIVGLTRTASQLKEIDNPHDSPDDALQTLNMETTSLTQASALDNPSSSTPKKSNRMTKLKRKLQDYWNNLEKVLGSSLKKIHLDGMAINKDGQVTDLTDHLPDDFKTLEDSSSADESDDKAFIEV